MKKLLLVLCAVTAAVGAEEKTPSDDAKFKLKVSGYSQVTSFYSWAETPSEEGLTTVRDQGAEVATSRLILKLDKERTGFFLEIGLTAMGEIDRNWLQKIYFHQDLSEEWELRVGRFLKSGGYTTPPPHMLETVKYPSAVPFGLTAWGIQLVGQRERWNIVADITGQSNGAFDNPETFDQFEVSTRITRLFEGSELSGTIELGSGWQRFGMDGMWQARTDTYIRGGLFHERHNSDRVSDFWGMYALGVYRPFRWLAFHIQADHGRDISKKYRDTIWQNEDGLTLAQEESFSTSGSARTALTGGLRLFSAKERFIFTADFETVIEESSKANSVLLRAQFKF